MSIVPDTKDWTWVLDQPCPDCGFDPAAVRREDIGPRVRANAALWPPLLAAPASRQRPAPATWSVLEYACHLRDVHRVFAERLELLLDHADPLFANWDQDAAAVDGHYGEQDPAAVADALIAAAERVADAWDAVPDDAWGRRGRRSNGSVFTVETLGRYQLHDLDHHAWDVRGAVTSTTLAAYDGAAAAYAGSTSALSMRQRERLDAFASAVGPGARVLEIGSASGRDADHLEHHGLRVRRTDVTPGFVDLLRAAGHRADLLDPLTDDLDDRDEPDSSPYDGVWASASLLHVARADLPVVLRRLAEATRRGGVLALSVKEGMGDHWSTHGSVPTPRRFVLWRAPDLVTELERAGWAVTDVHHDEGSRGETWVMVSARRLP